MSIPEGLEAALGFGFMDAIFTTRSRGLGLGMELKEGKRVKFGVVAEKEKLLKVLEFFRKSLVKLDDVRADLPKGEPGLFDFNAWNCNKPGTTFFVPVTNTTVEYMVLLFIYFGAKYGFNIIDELNGGRACGLDK